MNFTAFRNNVRTSGRICRGWRNRLGYLRWIYSRHSAQAAPRLLTFNYPPPVGEITVVVRNNRGSDAFIFDEVFNHGYYDFPLPRPPGHILDLGSNIGLTALYFGRKYPHAALACVEPIATNATLLTRNLGLNRLPATVFPAAISIADGFVEMHLDAHDYGHKIADIGYGKEITGRLVRVESLSIPTLLARLHWPRIGLLKIDIEGYEGILLRQNCEWLRQVDALCVECHENYGETDLIALAGKYGFAPPQALPGIWLLIRP